MPKHALLCQWKGIGNDCDCPVVPFNSIQTILMPIRLTPNGRKIRFSEKIPEQSLKKQVESAARLTLPVLVGFNGEKTVRNCLVYRQMCFLCLRFSRGWPNIWMPTHIYVRPHLFNWTLPFRPLFAIKSQHVSPFKRPAEPGSRPHLEHSVPSRPVPPAGRRVLGDV